MIPSLYHLKLDQDDISDSLPVNKDETKNIGNGLKKFKCTKSNWWTGHVKQMLSVPVLNIKGDF